MDYQSLTIVGNATADAQRRTSEKGDVAYTTFSLGVSDANKQTTFFPVTAFGKLGETAAQYITKGRQVLVEGRIDVSGNNYFNVVAGWIQLGARGAHDDGLDASERADGVGDSSEVASEEAQPATRDVS